MWVSLKSMEEEDLIFMNSVHCFSYFQSFKRFPDHQQTLHNTSGALCKLTARWARPPSIELMAHGHLLVSAPVGSGREMWREKVSPDCYTNRWKEILAYWYQGPLARTSPPNPTSPRPTSAHFLTLIFFLPQGNCTTSRDGPDPKGPLHTLREQFSAFACYRHCACVAEG